MMPDTIRPDVADYLADALACLADLSGDAYDEMADIVESAIQEVAAETDADIRDVLGAPDQFVAELRTAAGLVAQNPEARLGRLMPAVVQRATELRNGALTHTWTVWARELFHDLRPGWWVVRAWFLLYALQVLFGSDSSLDWTFGVPAPGVAPSVVSQALVVGGIVASVGLGRMSVAGWQRWGVIGLNVLAAIGLVAFLGQVRDDAMYSQATQNGERDAAPFETFVVDRDTILTIDGQPVVGLLSPDGIFVEVFTRDQLFQHFEALSQAYSGQPVSVETVTGSYMFDSVEQLSAVLGGPSSTVPIDRTAPVQE